MDITLNSLNSMGMSYCANSQVQNKKTASRSDSYNEISNYPMNYNNITFKGERRKKIEYSN